MQALTIFTALSLFLTIFMAVPAPVTRADTQPVTGLIIPLFMNPGPDWEAVIQARLAHPSVPIIAIVNPDNGPGSSLSIPVLNGVEDLQAAGVTVLGYVYTSYGSRSIGDVEADMDSYRTWYGVNGILFDEMSSSVTSLSYYTTLSSYAASTGLTFTVGNPGSDIDMGLVGVFNTTIIYEDPGLPTLSFLGGWHALFPRSDFAFIALGVSSLDSSFVQSASTHVGYLYVTNLTPPNPYIGLPSYFSDLVAALDPGNQSSATTTTTLAMTNSSTDTSATTSNVSSTEGSTVTSSSNGTTTQTVVPTTSTATATESSTITPPSNNTATQTVSSTTATPSTSTSTPIGHTSSTSPDQTATGSQTTGIDASSSGNSRPQVATGGPPPPAWFLISMGVVFASLFVILAWFRKSGVLALPWDHVAHASPPFVLPPFASPTKWR